MILGAQYIIFHEKLGYYNRRNWTKKSKSAQYFKDKSRATNRMEDIVLDDLHNENSKYEDIDFCDCELIQVNLICEKRLKIKPKLETMELFPEGENPVLERKKYNAIEH